jgi:ribose-phosphate pyrophosphokinase
MISTGGTIEAAIRALVDAGCTQEITVSVTHPLLEGDAIERLGRLPVRRLVISDSVPLPREPVASVDRVTLAPLLGEAIRRMSSGVQMAHAR